jgi:hypothetical protein
VGHGGGAADDVAGTRHELVPGQLVVAGEQLQHGLGHELVDVGHEDVGRERVAGDPRRLVAEAAAALDGEDQPGHLRPQGGDHLGRGVRIERVLGDDPLLVEVVDDRAVREDGEAAVAGVVGDRAHPPLGPARDEDHPDPGLLGGREGGPGAIGDAAVRSG